MAELVCRGVQVENFNIIALNYTFVIQMFSYNACNEIKSLVYSFYSQRLIYAFEHSVFDLSPSPQH